MTLRQFTASPLVRNILALYSIQGLQYLLPLIALPWLVHSMGASSYGIFNLALSFGAYLQLVGDYGFNLSATRTIALLRKDPLELSRVVSSIMLAKLFLIGSATLLALLCLHIIPSFRDYRIPLMIGCAAALASSLFPAWLFQGMERMVGMAQISMLAKALQLGLWVVFVHEPAHLQRALWIVLGINAATSSIAWLYAVRSFGVRPTRVGLNDTFHQLRNGLEVFLSQAGVAIFTNSNIVVLGSFCDARTIGLYSIAEKITRACINLGGPVGTAIFPKVSQLFQESQRLALAYLRRITVQVGAFFLTISIVLFATAPLAARMAGTHASDLADVALLIRILAILPFTIFLDNIFGTQILLNLGRRKTFMAGTLSAGLIGLICQLILIPRLHAQGAALSYLFSELWCLLYFGYFSNRLVHFMKA